jgi:hypothetical protein
LLSPSDRALILDNNQALWIVVYSADRQAACTTLAPAVGIRLGN